MDLYVDDAAIFASRRPKTSPIGYDLYVDDEPSSIAVDPKRRQTAMIYTSTTVQSSMAAVNSLKTMGKCSSIIGLNFA